MKAKKLLLFFPVVLGVLTLFQGIFLNRVLIDIDYLFQQIPFRSFAHNEIVAGRLPYVYPYSLLGIPILAHGQVGMFFPLTFFALIFKNQFVSYLLELVILFSLGFYGEYIFSAFYLKERTERILASLYYAFSPFIFVHIIHLNLIIPFILLPYSLYLVRRVKENKKYLALLCITFTLTFLSFHPQAAMIHVAITFIYAVFYFEKVKKLKGMLEAVFIAILLAGIQVVPFVFLKLFGGFVSHKGLSWMVQGSFDPFTSWPLFFIPLPYLRTPVHNTPPNGEIYFYIVGFLGIFSYIFSKRLKYKYTEIIPIIILGLFLMTVKYNPLYALLEKIPVLNSVRGHIRWWGGILPFVSIMVSLGLKEMSEDIKLKRDLLILGILPMIWVVYFAFVKLAAGNKWFYLFNIMDKINFTAFILWIVFSLLIVLIRRGRKILFVSLLTMEILLFSNLLYPYAGKDIIIKTIRDFKSYENARFASVALDLNTLNNLFVRNKAEVIQNFILFGTFFHGNFSYFLHAYNILGYVAPQLEPEYANKIRNLIYRGFLNKENVSESCGYLKRLHVGYLMSFRPVSDSLCLTLKETKDGMFIYSVSSPVRVAISYQNGFYTVSDIAKDSVVLIPLRYLPGLIAVDKYGRVLKMNIITPYLIKVHTDGKNIVILEYRPVWVYYGAAFSLFGIILFLSWFVKRRENA